MATKTKTKTPKLTLEAIIDQLGEVKAEAAVLKRREEELKELLIKTGVGEAETESYRAVVSRFTVTTVGYKDIVEELKPSASVIARHTSERDQTTVKITKIGE